VLAEQLGVASNALSFHLKELVHAGLISQERQGRNLICRASMVAMNDLLAYLTENCCQGVPCLGSDQPSFALIDVMTSTTQPLNVLFLCTHNSARSILAEALLNAMGQGRFRAYSAGSSPRENQQPNPLGLQVLQNAGISTQGLHSKSWDVFATPEAPQMDLIITVCDNAAGEVCPIWPGHPATAHWGYADPSEGDAPDDVKREAFRQTLHMIKRRLELLINLPADKLQQAGLQTSARELAKV
jgi:protein-tyrosine-phosphatase